MDSDETVVGGSNDGWQELPAGTMLDNYRIERLLGRGGMGAVYEVEQVRIGRRYAMKVLSSELSSDPDFQHRFETEGRTLAGLDHGHIVTIHYAGEAEVRGQCYAYLVMELLQPLSEWLEHNRPLEERAVRDMLTVLLTALDYAHSRGVVHRDLKPANLLRSGSGDLKVGDFGVAQVVGSDFMRTLVEQTVAQSRVGGAATQLGFGPSGRGSSSGYAGTLYYMAPEVIEGREATAQSDLYAVGVMAYEWLTGRKPVGRFKAVSRIRTDIAADWDDWVDTLLEYEPGERAASAKAALNELSKLGRDVPKGGTAATREETRFVQEAAPAHGALLVAQGQKPFVFEHAILDLPGGVQFELVWIAPGMFMMGSRGDFWGERDNPSDESPQMWVRLNKGFWLGKTPVTQGQWQALMESNPSHFKESGLNAPVENISWDEAMEYARKLTELECSAGRLPAGHVYTLPSEAQWEYACRAISATSIDSGQAGKSTRFYSGDSESDLGRAGWYQGNSGGKTHPSGSKAPNEWGLYDMHGNVFEWTRSWHGYYPGGSVVDYEGPASGSYRIVRGGSWNDTAQNCRSAYRFSFTPGFHNDSLGFRLALAPSP